MKITTAMHLAAHDTGERASKALLAHILGIRRQTVSVWIARHGDEIPELYELRLRQSKPHWFKPAAIRRADRAAAAEAARR